MDKRCHTGLPSAGVRGKIRDFEKSRKKRPPSTKRQALAQMVHMAPLRTPAYLSFFCGTIKYTQIGPSKVALGCMSPCTTGLLRSHQHVDQAGVQKCIFNCFLSLLRRFWTRCTNTSRVSIWLKRRMSWGCHIHPSGPSRFPKLSSLLSLHTRMKW